MRILSACAMLLSVGAIAPAQAQPKPPPVGSDRSTAQALRDLTAEYDKLSTAFLALQKQLQQILDDEQTATRQAVADLLRLSDALRDHVDKGELELTQKEHRIRIVLPEKTLFRPGQSGLTPSGRGLLQSVAKVLSGMPKRDVQIGARTEGAPGKSVQKGDLKLSMDRALGVLVVLAQSGVAASRLSATAYTGRAQKPSVEILLPPSAPELEP